MSIDWSVGQDGLRFAGRRRLRRIRRRARRPAACRFPTASTCSTPPALPEVACTVWSNLVMTAHLRAGQTAADPRRRQRHRHPRHPGRPRARRRVAVTAGSAEKLDLCRELGADDPDQLPRRGLRRAACARRPTARGADVILDIMGASYLDRNIDALATDGRLVIIGMQGGVKGELNIGKLLGKRAGVIGTALRARPVDGPGGKSEVVAEVVAQRLADDRRRPGAPDHRRRLPDRAGRRGAPTAGSGEVSGKVLLRVGGLALSPATPARAPAGRPRPSSSSAPGRSVTAPPMSLTPITSSTRELALAIASTPLSASRCTTRSAGTSVHREAQHRDPRLGPADHHHQRQRPQRHHQVVEQPVHVRRRGLH